MSGASTRKRYESLKVLYSTNCRPDYIPPIAFPGHTLVCGPSFETAEAQGRLASLRTPKVFDIAGLIRSLPRSQQPDLVVVRTDSALVNLPVNLAGVTCPKILLFADTHHTRDPLRTALHYAATEPFDRIILLYDRHHLHWFRDAGIDRVSFCPGLEVRDVSVKFSAERERQVVFVGTLGAMHPRRSWFIEELARRRYPLVARRAPREEAARISGRSLVTFNCSLNGDLNMRVFEALAAGGFLMTDRLSPESGLEGLFEDGRDLVCYDALDDFFAKLDHFLDHPAEAVAIARSGHERYVREHGARRKAEGLLRSVFENEPLPDYGLGADGRARRPRSGLSAVAARLPAYEFVQELHRRQEVVDVLCIGAPGQAVDLADLPRARPVALADAAGLAARHSLPGADGLARRVRVASTEQASRHEWHTVIAAGQAPESLGDVARRFSCMYLVVDGLAPEDYPATVAPLAAAGMRLMRIGTPVFVRAGSVRCVPGDRELVEPSRVTLFSRISELAPAIARIQGWINPEAGEALYRLARLHAPVATVVELGAWKGASSAWLAAGLRDRGQGRLYSVDTWAGSADEPEQRQLLEGYGRDQLFDEFRSNMAALDLTGLVEPLRADTLAAARQWPRERRIGLLYIDADHRYDAVRADFEAWAPHVAEGGFIVFDDVPSWEGPTRLVKELPPEYQMICSGYNNWICQKLPVTAGCGLPEPHPAS